MQDEVIVLLVLPRFALLVNKPAILGAGTQNYSGENHRLLLNNINHMSRNSPYSNTVPILQSSGTGKSRMVHEQSDLVFTLPINLRPASETKGNCLSWYIGSMI